MDNRFYDKYDHIKQGHDSYDGGDSLSFAGQYFPAQYFKHKYGLISHGEYQVEIMRYKKRVRSCYKGWGIFTRHSHYEDWCLEWDRMSRDQIKANIVAMGIVGEYKLLFKLLFFLMTRLMFMTNIRGNGKMEADYKLPDICAPDIWAMFIRALAPFFMLPIIIALPFALSGLIAGDLYGSILMVIFSILLLGDLFNVFGAIFNLQYGKKHPEESNDTNFIIQLLQSNIVLPTVFSWLAKKIYSKRHLAPPVEGITYDVPFGPQTALDYFFEGRNKIEPPISAEYRGFLHKELK